MVNLFYPNEEAKNYKLKNTEYYKQLGFDSGLFFGTMRLFGSLNDENHIIDYVTTDIETIKYRQQVFDDFRKNNGFRGDIERIMPHLQELLDMRKQLKESGDKTAHLYSICDMDLYFETLTDLDRIFKDATGLQSQALKDFGAFIAEKVNAPEFAEMKKRVEEAMDEVKNVKSITFGINLDAQLYPKEAGIVSINSDVYKSGNVVDKVLRAEVKSDAYTCMSPLEIVTKGMTPDEVNAVYDALNNALDVMFKASVKKFQPMVLEFLESNLDFLKEVVEQLTFYTAGCMLFDKLKVSYRLGVTKPIAHSMDEKVLHISGLYNPLYAIKETKRDLVTNNIIFDKVGQFYVLTGGTKTGKSLFTQAVGIAQIMFQLGMYVAADKAEMSPVDNVFALCPIDTGDKNRTKVEEDCAKIAAMLPELTEHSLLLLDGVLAPASNIEATYILENVVSVASKKCCRGILSTAFADIAESADEINSKVQGARIDTIVARVENERSLYIMDRERPEGGIFAKEIVQKYNLAL